MVSRKDMEAIEGHTVGLPEEVKVFPLPQSRPTVGGGAARGRECSQYLAFPIIEVSGRSSPALFQRECPADDATHYPSAALLMDKCLSGGHNVGLSDAVRR